jgi:hypothetical protein
MLEHLANASLLLSAFGHARSSAQTCIGMFLSIAVRACLTPNRASGGIRHHLISQARVKLFRTPENQLLRQYLLSPRIEGACHHEDGKNNQHPP